MKLRYCVFLIAVLVPWSPPTWAFDGETAKKGVVRIRVYGEDGEYITHGSGFMVTDTHIVTNAHVAEAGPRYRLYGPVLREPMPAELLASDEGQDLAVLSVDEQDAKGLDPLEITEVIPSVGSAVYSVGFPLVADEGAQGEDAADDKPTITSGSLGRVYKGDAFTWNEPVTILQHGATIYGGNSGGPLLDECTRVIGVNTAGHTEAETVRAASAIKHADRLLEENGIEVDPVTGECDPSASGIGRPLLLWGGAGAVGAVLLSAGLLLVMGLRIRRTREDLLHSMQRAAEPAVNTVRWSTRRGAGRDRTSTDSVDRPDFVLAGEDPDGEPVRVELSARELESSAEGHCVGRSPEVCDTVIEASGVSRRHARITFRDGAFWIEDVNSSEGTSMDGKALTPFVPEKLRDGQSLSVGPVALRVQGHSAGKA